MRTWWLKVVAILTVTMLVLCALPLSALAAFENKHNRTGDQRWDIVAVAESQLGYLEGSLEGGKFVSDNYTKYGLWYDKNVQSGGFYRGSWCAMFVSWCANQAGVSSDTLYYHAYCPYGRQWFETRGQFFYSPAFGGSYTPIPGDVIYFSDAGLNYAGHVGIVSHVENGYVHTIEGNADSMDEILDDDGGVFRRHYKLTDPVILGYAVPKYTDTTSTTAPTLGTYQVTADTLNVRTGPSVKEAVVSQMKKGDVFTVTRLEQEWGRIVRKDGSKGWCKLPRYTAYIGQDLLSGDIDSFADHVRITTDRNGRVTLTNNGAASVMVDLPVVTPLGTSTTPYINLSLTPLKGDCFWGLVDYESGYAMTYQSAGNRLADDRRGTMLGSYRAMQMCVKEWWLSKARHQIDCLRIEISAQSAVRVNYAYASAKRDVVTTTAYNTRPYDGSDVTTEMTTNLSLLDPDTLSVVDASAVGGYAYQNGTLTVYSEQEEGYAVTMSPNVPFYAEAVHRLLMDVEADVPYDVELIVSKPPLGKVTVSLASMLKYNNGEMISRKTCTAALGLFSTFGPLDCTVEQVTVKLGGAGTVTIRSLQVSDNDNFTTLTDDIVKSAHTPMAGDVNGDAVVNTLDVLAMYRAVSVGEEWEVTVFTDVNNDGVIDMTDVMELYRTVSGA